MTTFDSILLVGLTRPLVVPFADLSLFLLFASIVAIGVEFENWFCNWDFWNAVSPWLLKGSSSAHQYWWLFPKTRPGTGAQAQHSHTVCSNILNIPYIQVHPGASRCIRVHPSTSRYIQVHPGTFEYIQEHPGTPASTNIQNFINIDGCFPRHRQAEMPSWTNI